MSGSRRRSMFERWGGRCAARGATQRVAQSCPRRNAARDAAQHMVQRCMRRNMAICTCGRAAVCRSARSTHATAPAVHALTRCACELACCCVQTITGGSLRLVQDWERVYAVCPDSLPPAKAQQLQRESQCFARVATGNRVNMFWVKQCRVGRTLYEPATCSLFQPIPHRLPLPGFKSVCVLISGFGDGVRRAIVNSISILGGTCAPPHACHTPSTHVSATHLARSLHPRLSPHTLVCSRAA
jgi:hypothetical protein